MNFTTPKVTKLSDGTERLTSDLRDDAQKAATPLTNLT
jgi:hypothetical protein